MHVQHCLKLKTTHLRLVVSINHSNNIRNANCVTPASYVNRCHMSPTNGNHFIYTQQYGGYVFHALAINRYVMNVIQPSNHICVDDIQEGGDNIINC